MIENQRELEISAHYTKCVPRLLTANEFYCINAYNESDEYQIALAMRNS